MPCASKRAVLCCIETRKPLSSVKSLLSRPIGISEVELTDMIRAEHSVEHLLAAATVIPVHKLSASFLDYLGI
jgi:hypothetical protein